MLHKTQPDLNINFPGYSVYPAAAANMGPRSISLEHIDGLNSPVIPCALTAAGKYNPDEGGHIYLWDLKLVIRFPPGSTIIISSSCLRHGNTPIPSYQRRYTFTQYFPGGLVRWIQSGCKGHKLFTEEEQRKYDELCRARYAQAANIFSTMDSLASDRQLLILKEQSKMDL